MKRAGPGGGLPLFEPTYSVAELCDEIRQCLGLALPSVWVAGEVHRLRQHPKGHLYFELVEKGEGDRIVGKLEAVIWRTDFLRVRRMLAATGQEIEEGRQIRCLGNPDLYAPFGRLQLVVREVDPVFTLGLLAQRRRETLAALEAAALLTRNKELELPLLPLRIALITSDGSAAYHDFLSTLRESGYGFRVLFIHAAVQGQEAERQVASALGALAGLGIDCAALVRGGGSRTDLAAFDSRRVAEAVALAPVPVLTGLGHEIDQSIADLVAHTALKTPTKAAELLVGQVARADARLRELRRAVIGRAGEPLRRARAAVGRAEGGVDLARLRLRAAGTRLVDLGKALSRTSRLRLRSGRRRSAAIRDRLAQTAPRAAARLGRLPARSAQGIVTRARGRLAEARTAVTGWARLCHELLPERTLERGFSITRDAQGRLLREPRAVTPGERIVTQLVGGTLASRVEER